MTIAILVLALGATMFVGSGVLLAISFDRAVGPPPADLMASDVAIASRSGSMLRGWLAPGEPGAGAVVLLHGIRADRRTMLQRMRFLHDAGYSVLAIDLRAHGESSGTLITFGHLEALDAAAAVDFVREQCAGERIGVIGQSLGGAAALLAAEPLPVDALVIESVYPDIRSAIANRIALRLGAVPARLIAALYLELMPLILDVYEDQLRPIDHIGGLRAPLLLMAGTHDRHTTIEESRAFFERAPEPKLFWAVAGAAHVDLADHAPEDYRSRVLGFFGRYLRGEAAVPIPR